MLAVLISSCIDETGWIIIHVAVKIQQAKGKRNLMAFIALGNMFILVFLKHGPSNNII